MAPNTEAPRQNTEPSPEQVEAALDRRITRELAAFANDLETSRSGWRRFQELVEAPDYPARLRQAYVDQYGREPSDEDWEWDGEEAFFDDQGAYRESLRPEAVELVRHRLEWERKELERKDREGSEEQVLTASAPTADPLAALDALDTAGLLSEFGSLAEEMREFSSDSGLKLAIVAMRGAVHHGREHGIRRTPQPAA